MDDVLAHYGVKGMKWGIRRTPEQLGSKKKSSRKKTSGKKKTGKKSSSKPKKKKLSEMTDAEIKKEIERLKLEQSYNDLKRDKAKTNRGKSFAMDVLETIGKNTLTNIGTQAGVHILGTAINKAAGIDIHSKDYEKIRIVNPQKGQTDKK